MRLRPALLALLVALCALVGMTPAAAQTFPPLTGLVVDQANVLPAADRAALAAKLEALQKETGHQLVVATIASLEGYPIEDYGYRLGRAWGVGLKGADNGAILFVAPNEPAGRRGPRIEVGYGLEPVLTDAFSSVVINQAMMPRLRDGDVPGAMQAGADALIAQLRLPDEQARARAAAAATEFDKTHARRGNGAAVGGGILIWLLIAGFIGLTFLRRRSAARAGPWSDQRAYRDRRGSSWPIWLWAASEIARNAGHGSSGGSSGWGGGGAGGGSDGSWMGGGFTGGGGGSFGGGGASGDW